MARTEGGRSNAGALLGASSLVVLGWLAAVAAFWLFEDFADHRPPEIGSLGGRLFYAALTCSGLFAGDPSIARSFAGAWPGLGDVFVPRWIGVPVFVASLASFATALVITQRYEGTIRRTAWTLGIVLGAWLFFGFMVAAGKTV